MKKYINRYSISLFVMYFIMILSVSVLNSTIETSKSNLIISNNLMSENSKIIFNKNSNISNIEVLKILTNETNVFFKLTNIYYDKNIKASAIYANNELETNYPLITRK